MPHVFEYALLRAVPRPERGEFVNVGVLVYCAPLDYLGARVHVDEHRLRALDPSADVELLRAHLAHLGVSCDGDPKAGPVAATTPGRRFRWLTAPRSTVIQTSPAHTGLTDDPEASLEHLLRTLVLPPGH
ncbi:DUF3037 domain-containing protein [Saccharothrix algeriensis]|uniref:DUF3037 domain-containing protein n=1 Tax=Saccharothrix algeriensis TaxID=173560 RepID=A0A8T8I3U2_9PSEU|nr:DUF3037 domain-containing protein [Saccharothrix algeriensis]MBM7810562.1 hypothetical protein [Saccharothrix algeriensis]QTR04664.1 DUF3037 domain-containing protein [Saccharothrix algeriensis]